MPAFAAAYATEAPPGCLPAVDDIVTMDPRFRSVMPSAKVRTVMYVAVRLLSMTERQRVGVEMVEWLGAAVAARERQQDGRRPECRLRSSEQRIDIALVGALGSDADGTATGRRDRRDHSVECSPVPSRDDDSRAKGSEAARRAGADAARSAGDDDDLVAEVQCRRGVRIHPQMTVH